MTAAEKLQIFIRSLDPAYVNSAESFLSKSIDLLSQRHVLPALDELTTPAELARLVDMLAHSSEKLRKKALLLLGLLVLPDEQNSRLFAESLNLIPSQGKVLLNAGTLAKCSAHNRLGELLDVVNRLETRPEEPNKLFFFEPERALVQKNLQIYYISPENLYKLLSESKLSKVPDPAEVVCGFTIRPPVCSSRGFDSRNSSVVRTSARKPSVGSAPRKKVAPSGRTGSLGINTSLLSSGSKVSASKGSRRPSALGILGSDHKARLQLLLSQAASKVEASETSVTKRNLSRPRESIHQQLSMNQGSREKRMVSNQAKRRNQILGPGSATTDPSKGLFSPKTSLLTGMTSRSPGIAYGGTTQESRIGVPLFFKKESKRSKPKDKELNDIYSLAGYNAPLPIQTGLKHHDGSSGSVSTLAQNSHQSNSGVRKEPLEINRDNLLKLFASQQSKPDKQSNSFLSKFSLLSSKTSLGDSKKSVDQRDGSQPAVKSVLSGKSDAFRSSFLKKKL